MWPIEENDALHESGNDEVSSRPAEFRHEHVNGELDRLIECDLSCRQMALGRSIVRRTKVDVWTDFRRVLHSPNNELTIRTCAMCCCLIVCHVYAVILSAPANTGEVT